MTTASGARAGISYIIEATRGTTPTGTPFTSARLTERGAPQADVNELTSNEVTPFRQETTLRNGFSSVSGTLGFELARIAQDDWLELLTNDTWATFGGAAAVTDAGAYADVSAAQVPAQAVGTVIEHTPADANIALDIMLGSVAVVSASATAADIGVAFQVIARTATTITMATIGSPLTGTAAQITELTYGQRVFTTTDDLRTMSVQRRFPDISQYQVSAGVSVNQMTLQSRPESLITGTWGLLGMISNPFVQVEVEGTPTVNPGATTVGASPFSGCVYANGVRLGLVTGFDLDVNNNRSLQAVLCQSGSADIYEGVVSVTGSVSILFEDATYYNAFLNETELPLSLRSADPEVAGTMAPWMSFGMPRVRFTNPQFAIPTSGPIIQTFNFRALESSETDIGGAPHTLVVQRSQATA